MELADLLQAMETDRKKSWGKWYPWRPRSYLDSPNKTILTCQKTAENSYLKLKKERSKKFYFEVIAGKTM